MENTQVKVKSWLPIFSGFYNTQWEADLENEIYCINQDRKDNGLSQIDYDNLEFDDSQFEIDTVLSIIENLKDKLKDYIYDIEFEIIQHPKEYNFKNDSVDVIYTPNIDKIKAFIYENKTQFENYLRKVYTGYDGYIPFYSNDFKGWKDYTNDFTEYSGNGHYLGSILDFICAMLEINENDLYMEVKENGLYEGSYITNYSQCENNLTCDKCSKFIENAESIKEVNKYFNVMGFYPKNIICENCIE